MPLQIIRQDITKVNCDAIVNPSNTTPAYTTPAYTTPAYTTPA